MAEVVLVGASGMLGRAFVRALDAAGTPFTAPPRSVLDLCGTTLSAEAIPQGTRLVLNCAAYTDVDGAETDEARAHAINARGPGMLAARAAEVGATLVHFSTDYVFDGQGDAPYPVSHPIGPINAYGRTKAAGEAAVRAVTDDHLIVRTSWLYAPWSKNFVRTIARAARERDVLRVVDDQRGRPSSAQQLAETALALYRADARGTFHGTDAGECTWFEFATAIAAAVRPSCRVEPCATSEMPRPAPRPAYSVLDLRETEQRIGPRVDWRTALRFVLSSLDPEG